MTPPSSYLGAPGGGIPSSTGTYPVGADAPAVVTGGHLGSVGGRFIGRGRLTIGAAYWLAWLAFSRRSSVSSGVQREMQSLGIGALRLVLSASVLVGLIATFQLAYQLKQYGAEPMSAKAIGWFGARELGPLVAALLVVARSASAIAGEFASMSANAELDALRAMGLDPVKYLVAPKLGALLVCLPALTILADALIAAGGWAGTTIFLGFSSGVFVEQFQSALAVRDIVIGLGKSVVFAVTIAIVAADEGLNVERNVAAIGGAATRAVVFCMIGVLGADTLVNAIFYFIPGLV
ncbi:MAG TPA: ABC transporter permease [Gemmatimonadaceae bacterium]|nr:ABC transporter permease [Gemmatimonadaceae bacterium]